MLEQANTSSMELTPLTDSELEQVNGGLGFLAMVAAGIIGAALWEGTKYAYRRWG